MNLAHLATIMLVGFSVVGAFDSVYFHQLRFQLHARPETRKEHAWHTARAVLCPVWVACLFVVPAGGALLWLGTIFAGLDCIAAAGDVIEEPKSRRLYGGLPPLEYGLHIAVSMLHTAALTLILVDRPAAAWSLDAPWVTGPVIMDLRTLTAAALAGSGVLVTAQHLWHLVQGRARGVAAQPAVHAATTSGPTP